MLYFGRKLDIFGDVSTHGHNWAKMRNKEKNPYAKYGPERGQKEPRPAGLEPFRPAGLAHSEAQSASIFFSAKYSSTLACVLPKPPTRTAYIYTPKPPSKRGGSQRDSEESIQTRVQEIHLSWTQEKGDTRGLIVPRRHCKLEDSKGSIPCRRFRHHDRLRFA